jgi:hypothetical protein
LKLIQTTYYKWWSSCEKQLLFPGGVFQHQGLFYAVHLHHPKAYRVDTPPSYGYVSCGCFFHCNKLIILQALRHCPENIWIDMPSRRYIKDLERNRRHCYNCDDVYRPKGKHQYRPGYNCKTIYPFKQNCSIVNHCVGNIQFGDLTFIESSYADLGKPSTEQEKKIAPAFTTSQNHAYALYKESPILMKRQAIVGKQSLDFLDHSNLGGIELKSLYQQAINRMKSLQHHAKFAKEKPHIVPFPEHPFNIKYNYPLLTRIYPKTKILKLNDFRLTVGEWTEVLYFQQTTEQRQEAFNYLHNMLYNQWAPLPHYQHNMGHIRFPTVIIHDKPKSIRDQEKAARKDA